MDPLSIITNPEVASSIMEARLNQVEQQLMSNKRAPRVFTTTNGVVLKIRPVPTHVTREVLRQIKEPRVPSFFNEAKQRDEENPLDPEYLQALEEFKEAQVDLTNRAYLLHTEVFGELPEGIQHMDESGWDEDLEFIGIQVHDSGRERYVDWLKYYVLADIDFRDLMGAILTAGGLVTEEAVKGAIESFPDNKNGTSDINIPIE